MGRGWAGLSLEINCLCSSVVDSEGVRERKCDSAFLLGDSSEMFNQGGSDPCASRTWYNKLGDLAS